MRLLKLVAIPALICISGTAYAVPEITPVFSRYAVSEGYVNLLVRPMSPESLSKGFTTTLRYGANEFTETHSFEITSYLNYAQLIRLKDRISGKAGDNVHYSVTITDTDGSSFVCEGDMRFVNPLEKERGILVEEATGTWCGNCVRGIVGMATLEERYGERFVGAAVHYNDPMQCEYYELLSEAGFASSFPMVAVNRTVGSLDPYYGTAEAGMWSNVSAFEAAIGEAPIAVLDVSAQYSSLMSKVWLSCTSEWSYVEEGHEYGYAFAIVENDVHRDMRGYNQQNSMAGHSNKGVWEWIEKAGSPIPAKDMWYQEVARCVECFDGTPLTETSVAGKKNVFEYELEFPDNVLEGKNQVVEVSLIDKTTGEVVCAAKVPFDEIRRGERLPLFYCGGQWGYLTPGMETFDLDGMEPFAGIPVVKGEGWSVVRPSGDDSSENGNYVMASTSYYRAPGQSDDWMVSAPVELPEKGKNTLSWRSRSSLAEARDGFEVYIAENATSPADFLATGKRIFSTDAENCEWTAHEIGLDDYSGKTVRIAFRNNSRNCEMLYVDDFTVDNDLRNSGIYETIADPGLGSALSITTDGGILKVVDHYDGTVCMELYSLQGQRIVSERGKGTVQVNIGKLDQTGLSGSVVIVRAYNDSQSLTRKIKL